MKKLLVALVLGCGLPAIALSDPVPIIKTIYVDDDAPLGGNGTNWDMAFKYLQDALFVAQRGDTIHVADGTYKPDQDELGNVVEGDWEATFQLVNEVTITGGFGGESILSGDIGEIGSTYNNSWIVVTGSRTRATATLVGFTISGAYHNAYGNGMYNYEGSPTLVDCLFTNNNGGGMYNGKSSNPTLTSCTFANNTAVRGGGMFNDRDSNPTLTGCTFSGNTASYRGGGMYNEVQSNVTLTDCTFSGNSAIQPCCGNGAGGGIYNCNSITPTLTNCTFSGNSADRGGGMFSDGGSAPTVIGCTFAENFAIERGGGVYDHMGTYIGCTFTENTTDNYGGGVSTSSGNFVNCLFVSNEAIGYGGGMFSTYTPTLTNCTFTQNVTNTYGGGIYVYPGPSPISSPVISNCILWNNIPDAITNDTAVVSFSNIQDGYPGEGNMNIDPLFVVNGLRLSADSPCIDAGDNTAVPEDVLTDLDGNPRFVGIVDMGAYEYQLTVSDMVSCMHGPGFLGCVPYDFDRDDDVDLSDFAAFQNQFYN